MKKTGFIYHPIYLKHDTEPHPENPGRLKSILRKLENSEVNDSLIRIEPRLASVEEISTVHDIGYTELIRQKIEEGARSLDMDTRVGPESYNSALMSAGAGLVAIDLILNGTCDNIFCFIESLSISAPPFLSPLYNTLFVFC